MNNTNGKSKLGELSHSRVWWLIASAIAVAIIVGLGTLDLIRLLARPLALFILGVTLAAALAPVVSWLQRWMPRLLAMLLVYFTLLVIVGGLLWWIVPALVNQLADLVSRLPDLLDRASAWINSWQGNLPGNTFSNGILSQLSQLGPTLLSLPLSITSALFEVILILFTSFYTLLEAPYIRDFFLSLFPEERRSRVQEVSLSMVDAMGGYVRGAIINGLITGFLIFVGLLFFGVDFALIFGVMAGLLELLPVVGPIVAGVIILGLTLLQSPGKVLTILIFMIVVEQLEGHILVPNIMHSQTNISSLMAVLALFAGAVVGGLLGALVAIPVAAALRVLVQQVIAPAIRRRTGAEALEGAEP